MEQQFLENIYNGTLNTFLVGFNEQEKQELLSNYKQYIIDSYSNVLEQDDDINKVTQLFIDIENKKWQNKTKEEKLILVVRDKHLDHLKYLSNIAFKYAQARLGQAITNQSTIQELTEEQAKKYIQEMEECIENIQPHNLKIARTYLSEGTIDFMYAAKLTDNMSLRVGKMR